MERYTMQVVGNFEAAFSDIDEYWSPRIVSRINDHYVKVARLLDQLAWHKHDDEDEMFYIVKGSLRIEYEDGNALLDKGDFHVVPKGKLHNPVADEECWIVLIEPVSTKHTGDLVIDQTRSIEEQMGTMPTTGDL